MNVELTNRGHQQCPDNFHETGSAAFPLSSCAHILFIFIIISSLAAGPIAEGSAKFLGNISSGTPPSNFENYWNQLTLENGGKWALVQSSQDSFRWRAIDSAYNYTRSKGFPYKQHCFVWGSQYPSWITSLSTQEQRAAVENWIKAYGERFPETEFIDVVNEPTTTPCPLKNALGGDGATGWDWVVTSFEFARKYCPNSKLLINEFAVENNVGSAARYLGIVKILKEKNLIDGVGIQSHCFNIQGTPLSTIKKCLDTLASSGLPLYPSEFDITGSEMAQLTDYQNIFPVFWEHPAVKGVTLWGWTSNWRGGIIMSGDKELAALKWLRVYVDSLEPTGVFGRGTGNASFSPMKIALTGRDGISFHFNSFQELSLTVIDPMGRRVLSRSHRSFVSGNNLIPWPRQSVCNGVCFVDAHGALFQTTQKFFIAR